MPMSSRQAGFYFFLGGGGGGGGGALNMYGRGHSEQTFCKECTERCIIIDPFQMKTHF